MHQAKLEMSGEGMVQSCIAICNMAVGTLFVAGYMWWQRLA